MSKQILIYIPQDYEKKEETIKCLNDLNISVVLLQESDFYHTLAFMAKMIKKDNVEPISIPENIYKAFMIMDGMSDEEISNMLSTLKDNNLSFDAPKAVITKHNQGWRLIDLYYELIEEHMFFQIYDDIIRLLKEANSKVIEEYEEKSWCIYQEVFMRAYMMVNGEMPSIDVLKDAHNQLIQAEKQLVKK